MEIVTVPVERDLLGEGPVWDDRQQALYWSDQLGRKVRRYLPAIGEYREWAVPKPLGCIALTDGDSLLIGGADLDVLYVTSVRETGMLIKSGHPQAGALFAITGLDVRGAPEGRFAAGPSRNLGTGVERATVNADTRGGGE